MLERIARDCKVEQIMVGDWTYHKCGWRLKTAITPLQINASSPKPLGGPIRQTDPDPQHLSKEASGVCAPDSPANIGQSLETMVPQCCRGPTKVSGDHGP